MQPRTTRSTVRFRRPARLPGLDDPLPAGLYEFVVEEEPIDGLSFEAFHRTASWLMRSGPQGGAREMLPVTPRDLDAALDRDRGDVGEEDPPAPPRRPA